MAAHTQEESAGGPADTGYLLQNMVLFGRLLRAGGLDVTPTQLTDWVDALSLLDLAQKRDVRQASRALLVSKRDDLDWFELAFDLFWQARAPEQLQDMEMGLLIQRTQKKTSKSVLQRLADGSEAEAQGPPRQATVYSARESLKQKNFADLTAEELAEIKQLMHTMRWKLDNRRTRRTTKSHRGKTPDLRSILRKSLRTAGEPILIPKLTQKEKQRPLVLLCDVSGSMEPYARLLLHFIYAINHQDTHNRGLDKIEAFAFGTRLTRITQTFRQRDPDRAINGATQLINDWGGGTRTGESLEEFNRVWNRRVLGQGAVVLMISDGWDRGDIDLMSRQMAHLARSCYQLLWLNPLLGSAGYEPLTRGMQAALPHLDHFLPVHNLNSLEQLGTLLESL